MNLWYSSLENISEYIMKTNILEEDDNDKEKEELENIKNDPMIGKSYVNLMNRLENNMPET
jgi:hypothetical protein